MKHKTAHKTQNNQQQNNTKPITTPFPYMGIHGNTFGNTWEYMYSQGLGNTWEYIGNTSAEIVYKSIYRSL